MKKKLLTLALAATMALGALALAACSPDAADEGAAGGDAATAVAGPETATEDSLYAYHTALNQDWSNVAEVSVATCTSEPACHGGSWDEVVAETEAMWEGVGQITDANPHSAHAFSGYTCESCHSLYETNINQCNGCHNFDSPANWIDKDPMTTVYGVATEEPLSEL